MNKFIVCVLAAFSMSAVAAAQSASDGYVYPSVDPSIPWAPICFLLLGLGLICAVAFKNSKRTHLD